MKPNPYEAPRHSTQPNRRPDAWLKWIGFTVIAVPVALFALVVLFLILGFVLLAIDGFDGYGATVRTLRQFIRSYHDLVGAVRDIVLPDPDVART